MAETIVPKPVSVQTQKNVLSYFETHDLKYVAEDVIFRNLSTGEVYKGRAEVGAMLHFMYHVAFDAKAEIKNYVLTEEKAVIEALFKGKHIGEIQGVQPTYKEVSVPLCVSYDLKNGLIQEARIYLQTDVMQRQLGVSERTALPQTTYLVRDIFQLKFGHFRDAKQLLKEALQKKLMPQDSARVFTDFTGEAYRLIFEEGFNTLNDFEVSLTNSMRTSDWQQWYEKFKPHVERSYREILKQVV